MKSIYLKEATAEKLRSKADTNYIQRMQQLADKDEPLTFSVFKDTGRLITKKDFFLNFEQKGTVSEDCTQVMMYIGNRYIQLLKNGDWWTVTETGDAVSTELPLLEEVVFNTYYGNE